MRSGWTSGCSPWRGALLAGALLSAAGCGTEALTGPAATDPPAPATAASSGSTVAPGSAPVELDEVTVTDPELGSLTFPVRAAGDASAAAEGRAVLLLHGFPETSASWAPIMAALADAGYYAVAFDQRGYAPGARPEPVEQYAMAHLVDDVYAVADALGIERFHVVGHDWGAAVAWSVAGRDANQDLGRVQSLTALSVGHPLAFAAARADPASDQGRQSAYMDTFRQPGSEDRLLADDAEVFRLLFTGSGLDEEIDDYLEVLGDPAALRSALNWYRAMELVSVDSAADIEVPTLMVWSSADIALGREQATESAGHVSGSFTYVELDGISHWIPAQAPAAVVEDLLPHLAATGS